MEMAPDYIKSVLTALWREGYEAYPVGGCVRDTLLGMPPADWDLCSSARPEQTLAVFADRRCAQTGLKHGTVTVVEESHPVEITTFRTESGYGDNRHPDQVAFVKNLRDDLSRRDFTINAMAFAPDGGLIDPFGGQADLRAGVIRCVGQANKRFQEDALRMLRALRFASRLGFRIEETTAAAIHANRALLGKISAERLFSELRGILMGERAGEILRSFGDVFFVFLPELAAEKGFDQKNPNHIHDIWTHTTMAVDAIEKDPVLRLTMLLHDVGKPKKYCMDENGVGHFHGHAEAGAVTAETMLCRLRCDNATREETVQLIRYHNIEPPQLAKGVRRLVTKLGPDRVRRLIQCWKADSEDRAEHIRSRNLAVIGRTEELLSALMAEEACFSLKELAVNGDDILALGVGKGPVVGDILRELFRLVTEENLANDRAVLLEKAQKLAKQAKNDCVLWESILE